MRNINKVILIGNVARVPEIRTTTGGQKMTTFVLATNRTWYDPQGNKQSQAEFHNMLAWGKIADICQKFLQKSTLVYIEGYLKTRSWEGEGGTRFYRTEIVVQDVLVLDKGIRHGNTSVPAEVASAVAEDNFTEDAAIDFSSDTNNILMDEKPASEIEKSFHEKLSEGNHSQADITLGEGDSPSDDNIQSISLDEPLFEEESK